LLDLKLCPYIVTAIDPGLSGAVARLEKGVLTVERDFKSLRDINRAVQHLVPTSDLVILEAVHSRPGEGVCSVFTFGKSTGTALGSVFSHHVLNPVEVAPQKWQNYFKGLFGVKQSFKEVTREIAVKIFPQQAELFAWKKDHNTADAALMAVYGALNYSALIALRESLAANVSGQGKSRPKRSSARARSSQSKGISLFREKAA
jgi:crossover junction endodeoxyribonuclease RuvC